MSEVVDKFKIKKRLIFRSVGGVGYTVKKSRLREV